MGTEAVDNIEHHAHENNSHTNGNSHYKHRVQSPDKGQIRHSLLGPQPHRLQ